MKASTLPLRGLGDARLAIHAASHLPAWLWAIDGTRILWANPTGTRLFGADRLRDFDGRTFGPADPHRRQIAQLAGRLRADAPARLERLRGFGAPLGRLATCACSRLTQADGTDAILIVAMEAAGRAIPLRDRLKRLVEDAEIPLAAFGSDGVFVGASDAARALLGFRDLSEAGLDDARDAALKFGRAETPVGLGQLVLQRVGSGADVGLIALLDPAIAPLPHAPIKTPEPAAHDKSDSEFLFVDEFDDADEPDPTPAPNAPEATTIAEPEVLLSPEPHDEPTVAEIPPEDLMPPRTEPLRFLWEIDARDHFRINSNELPYLIGEDAAASLDAPWKDVALNYASYGRMAAAIASEAAWSGIPLSLPTDHWDEPLTADLSGIPTYQGGEFAGYRGFGVIHDLVALTRLEKAREREARGLAPQSLSAHSPSAPLMDLFDTPPQFSVELPQTDDSQAHDIHPHENVVPLRPTAEGWSPALTPGENNAFNELARELSARLEAEQMAVPAPPPRPKPEPAPPHEDGAGARALLDLSPAPMAVHRGNRLLYANIAFIAQSGHHDLASLQAAPFDPGTLANATSTALDWDGERARALVVSSPPQPETSSEPADDHAEDFGAILDAADEAILMFDAGGAIRAGNRSAARLFGVHGDALLSSELASLFTADTQVAIAPLLQRLNETDHAQAMEARSVVGGRELPLRVTLGRARPGSSNFYAIVRDLTPQKKSESDLAQARRQTERASADKADILARVSHEMRSPLSAIIGFADVMIEQRFGPLGSDRYADYLRDIRGCGERVVAIVDDLLDLSRIETGKRDLAPAPHDLNDLVEQCVLAMQPQANRERIIIRSSLAHPLPQVVADGASLRQIALNLIDNSIHLANPGGQVIVSTVRADSGDVLLRVRDTGHGLNDNEVASALAPFRSADEETTPTQIRLSLTRALAEANSARFTVKPALYAGTLIEVAFSPAQAQA